jgi:multicomponent Na+:H+ antiporter subunit D
VAVVAVLALVLVAIGVGFDPVYAAAEAAAEAAVDPQGYVEAVDPTTASQALNGTSAGGSEGSAHALTGTEVDR